MRARVKWSASCALLLLLAGVLPHTLVWPRRQPTPAHSTVPLAPVASENVLTGKVFWDGAAAAGARVRVKGQLPFTWSDSAGRFRLPRPEGDALFVTAAKPGFYVRGAAVDGRPLAIELDPLPAGDWEDYPWIDPAPDAARELSCGKCH